MLRFIQGFRTIHIGKKQNNIATVLLQAHTASQRMFCRHSRQTMRTRVRSSSQFLTMRTISRDSASICGPCITRWTRNSICRLVLEWVLHCAHFLDTYQSTDKRRVHIIFTDCNMPQTEALFVTGKHIAAEYRSLCSCVVYATSHLLADTDPDNRRTVAKYEIKWGQRKT